MALLFFGLLVPLGIRSGGASLALPALFGLGTALPLIAFATFLSLGRGLARDWVRRVRGSDRFVRAVAGMVFLLAGIHDTFLYWLL